MFISRPMRLALRLFMGLVLVVLYFPLLYVARLSVATSKGFAWPPSGSRSTTGRTPATHKAPGTR